MEFDEEYKEKTCKVTITLHVSALKYDIENPAWIQTENIDNIHVRRFTRDIVQGGNWHRVLRILNLAYQECLDMLAPYVKRDMQDNIEVDNRLTYPDPYVVTMKVPGCFDLRVVPYLKELIHDYMVTRVLEDWCSIAFPEGEPVWAMKLEQLKSKINIIKERRTTHEQLRQSPF